MKAIDIKLRLTFLSFCFATFILTFGVTSCSSGKPSKSDIDKFISDYSNENFDNLKGAFIHIKDHDRDGAFYVVSNMNPGNSPYMIKCEYGSGKILEIRNHLILDRGEKEYFTKEQIETYMKHFFSYDFYLLGVDSVGNVFINPFRHEEPAYLLRLAEPTNEEIIKKGFVYKHYKDNWYINSRNLN